MVAKFIANVKHDTRMYFLSWRAQFVGATKLRGALMLEVLGMIVNNIGLMLAWLFLFDKFGTINGWHAIDYIGVQGINMVLFGIVILFNAGLTELPRYVDRGTFDTFLTKPTSVLMQVASSIVQVSTIGDLILGIILMTWYVVHIGAGAIAILLFLAAMAIGAMVLYSFTLLPYLLAFYLFDSDKVAQNIRFFFMDTAIYPTGVISGGIRTFLLTAFPGLFIGVVPIEVVRDVNWQYVVLGLVVATFWLGLSLVLFRRSLRKYESANLVGAR